VAGYHSGCSVPIRHDGRPVGALSLSDSQHRPEMTSLLDELEVVGELLGPALVCRGAARLTRREDELLALLDEGLRFKQVARRLGISEATAKTHGRNLFRKLGASSRAEAVHRARERGLLA
jgi:LuxR family maltose regulon positive regulatory protein